MSMCKIVFRNGKQMQIEAEVIAVDACGALRLSEYKENGNTGAVAIFAHGVWAYYLWVKMEG